MTAPKDWLLGNIKDLLETGEYSDLTIACGADTYKVHKAIVCNESEFFKRVVSFGGQESQSNLIKLDHDDPGVIELLLQFLYTGAYEEISLNDGQSVAPKPKPATNNSGLSYTYQFPHTCNLREPHNIQPICPHHTCPYDWKSPYGWYLGYVESYNCGHCSTPKEDEQLLITHSQMYEIAEKYDVKGLKEVAAARFAKSCENSWDSPWFSLAAHHAFATTPEHDESLRTIVAKTISDHMVLLKKPDIEALMLEFSSLAVRLLKEKCMPQY